MVWDARDVWVVIPVYNEGPVVAEVVTAASAVFPNIVCIDDGSSDDSITQIRQTQAHLVRHAINLGQGAALQTGMRYALTHGGGRYFVTFDADGQHRIEDVPAMIDQIDSGRADVVLGSRFLQDADTVPPLRRIVLKAVAALGPTSRRLHLTDAHNGLRVFSRAAAEDLQITQNGMAHASEIVGWLAHARWVVAEAPVTVRYTAYSRHKGQSLINGVNILFDVSLNRRGR